MNTFFALMAEYGTAQIPVEKCAHLFGLSSKKAEEYAGRQKLPVPCFRLGSQKSPWLIDAVILSKFVDQQMSQAVREWNGIRTLNAANKQHE